MFDRTECACHGCIAACSHRPGWATPAEIRTLIDAGHGARLMLECWCPTTLPDGDEIQLLSVATVGNTAGIAPIDPRARCTFLTAEDRCEIYEHRPTECAIALTCQGQDAHRYIDQLVAEVYLPWQTAEAQAMVDAWKTEHGVEGAAPASDMLDALAFGLGALLRGLNPRDYWTES